MRKNVKEQAVSAENGHRERDRGYHETDRECRKMSRGYRETDRQHRKRSRGYRCSTREKAVCFFGCVAATVLICWLFYHSWLAMVLLAPLYVLVRKEYEKKRYRQQKEQLLWEFKDGIQAVSISLLAGHSMENAWREAEKEMKELYGKESLFYPEICRMNTLVRMNRPLESVLLEFADQSGCEEIESFAEVFSFAKRSGGDFAGMIQTTVWKLAGRIEVEREIETVLAGKKLEGRIMNLMPMLILAYLNVCSGDFLQVLYGNVCGAAVMSGALGIYVAAVKWSECILDIQI